MCFTKEMTLAYGLILTTLGFILMRSSIPLVRNSYILAFYFALMEWLQFFGYVCLEQKWSQETNQLITFLTWIQIAFQPLVVTYALLNNTMLKDEKRSKTLKWREQDYIIFRYTLVGVFLDFSMLRWDGYESLDNIETRWHKGQNLSLYQGPYHIGWTFPMESPTYELSGFHHFFYMFMPYFVELEPEKMVGGIFLYLTGPFLSKELCENDLNSVGAIWCFSSVAQVVLPVFMDLADAYKVKWKELLIRFIGISIAGAMLVGNGLIVQSVKANHMSSLTNCGDGMRLGNGQCPEILTNST